MLRPLSTEGYQRSQEGVVVPLLFLIYGRDERVTNVRFREELTQEQCVALFRFVLFVLHHILEVPLILRPDVDFFEVDLTVSMGGHNELRARCKVHYHKLDAIRTVETPNNKTSMSIEKNHRNAGTFQRTKMSPSVSPSSSLMVLRLFWLPELIGTPAYHLERPLAVGRIQLNPCL